MQEIYQRVANWNSLRYEQEFDLDLSISMLQEETEEFIDASSEAERVDALCDIIYVALGCLWKLRIPMCTNTLSSFIDYYETVGFSVEVFCSDICSNSTTSTLRTFRGPLVQAVNLHTLIAACYVTLCMMFNSRDLATRALLAVCDSNDSKEAQKTEPNVKANGSSKGPNYFSPTEKLLALLEERNNV